MTVYYLDPESGNDANDGTTFALRKKTVASFTSAILASGDTVRIIASPDPVSPGDATWTDSSGTVTWSADKNAIIDNCDSGWTAAANITATHITTAFKQGTGSLNLTPAAGFTTGLMAYKALGATLDLSAFEGVSLWGYGGGLTAAGGLELRLCSDGVGAVAVHAIPLEAMATSSWAAHTWDNGGALSSGINSVAIYATADPGTAAIRFDNIVACKGVASADYVSHKHAIGKNSIGEPEWYSILSIAANSVRIGGHGAVNLGTSGQIPARDYRGTTETVATYSLFGIAPPGASSAERTIQESGTEAAPLVFSGGWNRTDMSTQAGVTYFQGRHYWGEAIALNCSWVRIEKVGGLNFLTALVLSSGSADLDLDLESTAGCAGGVYRGSTSDTRSLRVKFKGIQGGQPGGVSFGAITSDGGSSRSRAVVQGDRIHGGCSAASTVAALYAMGNYKYFIGRIDNNAGLGVNNATIALGVAELYGTVFSNNASFDVDVRTVAGDLRLFGCTYSTVGMGAAAANSRVFSTRRAGVVDDHATHTRYYTVETDPSVRHTASGVAWAITDITVAAELNLQAPASFPLAKVAVNASALVTVKCWVRRTNTGLSVSIRLVPSDIVGTPLTIDETQMTAAADTWEELTLTFTPTGAGVVEIEGCAWGGTTYTAYFDDMTITQA